MNALLNSGVEVREERITALRQDNAKLVGEVARLQKQVTEVQAQNAAPEATGPESPAATESKAAKERPKAETLAAAAKSEAPAWGPRTAKASGEVKAKDKWAGFRGLKWATKIEDAPGMVLVEGKGDRKFYRCEGEKCTLGGAKLREITYVFYKGRFTSVMIDAEGLRNWIAFRDAVFATYGEGHKSNRFIEEWWWDSAHSNAVEEAWMYLGYNNIAEKTTLLIVYKPIEAEEKADEAKQAKEGAKDF